MLPRKKNATPGTPPTPGNGRRAPAAPRPPLLHGEPSSGIEGGEVETVREDDLVGTSSSHTPERDLRAEEPTGELAPSADTEGGVD